MHSKNKIVVMLKIIKLIKAAPTHKVRYVQSKHNYEYMAK